MKPGMGIQKGTRGHAEMVHKAACALGRPQLRLPPHYGGDCPLYSSLTPQSYRRAAVMHFDGFSKDLVTCAVFEWVRVAGVTVQGCQVLRRGGSA